MSLRNTLLLSAAFVGSALAVEPTWIPAFADKPVGEDLKAEVDQALPQEPLVAPSATRRVLVYSATAGFRHKSIPTGKYALEQMGQVTGAYETVISDDPANFEAAALAGFDAVVLLNTTMDFFMPNPVLKEQFSEADWLALEARQDRLVGNLVAYVEAGGGLVGIHAATDSCYTHEAYGLMIGGYFDGHPWRAKDRVVIVVEDPTHALNEPVFQGLPDFELVEEIYQFKDKPYSRERLRILLHLDPERSDEVKGKKREDNDYPVAWVQQFGKGRVFYSALGHNHHIYANPMLLKHYLAGIQFACGDLPADTTPSARLLMPNLDSTGGARLPACCGH